MSSHILSTVDAPTTPDQPEEYKFFSDNPYPPHRFMNKSIGQIYNEYNNKDIEPHPCQRNFVWTDEKKQRFLNTISKKGPISGPQFNANSDSVSEIMDGQNRIRTIIQFMDDEFEFENEDGRRIKYSLMNVSSQRIFRNIQVSYTETSEWTVEQCEENFCEIQEGMPLTDGEIINSSSSNPLSVATKEIYNEFKDFITSSPKDCGMGFNAKRYKHLEIIGTLINMVQKGKFPQKPGKTALNLFDSYKSDGNGNLDELNNAKEKVRLILESYKQLVKRIPELQKKKNKKDNWESAIAEAHMFRSAYFVYKNLIYNDTLTDNIIKKFKNMIVKTHLIRTKEEQELWENIKILGQNNPYEIYDIYLKIFNEDV